MDNNPIIASLIIDVEYDKVLQILPGEVKEDSEHYCHINWATQSLIPVTEEHIDELVQINQAFYRNFLTKTIKDFPIL